MAQKENNDMKKIGFLALLFASMSLASCDLFEMDNYESPSETIHGAVVDAETGDSIRTDQGSEGIRVRLTQLDYSENASHNPDFYCMMDGSFQNTKLFEASIMCGLMDLLSHWCARVKMVCLWLMKQRM